VILEIRLPFGTDLYDDIVTQVPSHAAGGAGHPAYSHVAAATPDGALHVVDLWESPDAFGSFAERELAPIAGDRMSELQPRFIPVYNTLPGRATAAA
jgi:hypothetical protein